jgi:hypothetical protein
MTSLVLLHDNEPPFDECTLIEFRARQIWHFGATSPELDRSRRNHWRKADD